MPRCKRCWNTQGRKFATEHPDSVRESEKRWKKKNPEKVREKNRRYRRKYPEKIQELGKRHRRKIKGTPAEIKRKTKVAKWMRDRRKSHPEFGIRQNLSGKLNKLLRGKKKSAPFLQILGCSIPHLKLWLTFYFQPGMSWSNYGQWQVDHIRPCATFDLTDPAQQRECFNYTNLQPLWAEENRIKSCKW